VSHEIIANNERDMLKGVEMLPQEQIDFIFKVLDATNTNLSKFSRLTSISRTTLYKWKNGDSTGDKFRLAAAVKHAKRLHISRFGEAGLP